MINWKKFNGLEGFKAIVGQESNPLLLFKHSSRCSLSTMALERLERHWQQDMGVACYLINVINEREVSNEIAKTYDVVHESPQVLLCVKDQCLYHASHIEINFSVISKEISKLKIK